MIIKEYGSTREIQRTLLEILDEKPELVAIINSAISNLNAVFLSEIPAGMSYDKKNQHIINAKNCAPRTEGLVGNVNEILRKNGKTYILIQFKSDVNLIIFHSYMKQ